MSHYTRRRLFISLATILCVTGISWPVLAQISRLPDDIQKKLAEINPLYQSDIGKYGPETLRLFTPLLATAPKVGVTVFADKAYGADPRQTLDVYQPQGANNLPVIVFVHGG